MDNNPKQIVSIFPTRKYDSFYCNSRLGQGDLKSYSRNRLSKIRTVYNFKEELLLLKEITEKNINDLLYLVRNAECRSISLAALKFLLKFRCLSEKQLCDLAVSHKVKESVLAQVQTALLNGGFSVIKKKLIYFSRCGVTPTLAKKAFSLLLKDEDLSLVDIESVLLNPKHRAVTTLANKKILDYQIAQRQGEVLFRAFRLRNNYKDH